MWLEDADGIAEIWKGSLAYYLIIFLPILIIVSPVCPVSASHEFTVFRMQQYDIHGVAHGCRNAPLNLEARSLAGWSTPRHCVVTLLQNLTVDRFREVRAKAGGLVVVLPRDVSDLTAEEKQQLMVLEDAMLAEEITVPVYFATWTEELQNVVRDLTYAFVTDDGSGSAAEALLNSVSGNGYQVVVTSGSAAVKSDVKIATLQGRLSGLASEGKAPTIAVVAHYDSFGVAPELAYGADSNGSGVAALFELARLFSVLYSNPKTHGKYNIIFLLTGGGKFNYQGSKKWLEDQLDSLEGSVIQEASYVMCLDSLASGSSLYMHVSKPPKEGSPSSDFFKELKTVSQVHPDAQVDGVHKKINLADELLAWEHERFSIRRLPAFTLSALKSHRDLSRSSVLDVKEFVDVDKLERNVQTIADALARQIYNVSHGRLFGGPSSVSREALDTWISYLSGQPRSAQINCDKNNHLVHTLKSTMNKYLKDVKVSYVTPDKREPEFLFYDVTRATLNVYSVKPAMFDLVLTFAIVLYLTAVYLILQYFPYIYSGAAAIATKSHKVKTR